MNYGDYQHNCNELKNHLYCAGTVYDSFEALIEVLGRLKMEQPLYLVYLAQKVFAQEVFNAANGQGDDISHRYAPIEVKTQNQHTNIN
ncbi:MAG: hypothetical protein IKO06_04220 [Alphaproteobacteria bacterium]|nr:hypothetical protein [Alphaproteobacteria bacterium]